MSELGTGFVAELRAWLDRSARRREAASASFRRALNETQIYLGKLQQDPTRDYTKEEELSRLWSDAGRDILQVDFGFSHHCYELSRFWATRTGFESFTATSLLSVLNSTYEEARKIPLHATNIFPRDVFRPPKSRS